jgi:hypothetical protein
VKKKKADWRLNTEDVNKELELTTKFKVDSLLFQVIDKIGAKKTLTHLIRSFAEISGDKTCFPSSLLAIPADEENLRAMFILQYALENWEKTSNAGMKYWKKVVLPRIKKRQEEKERAKAQTETLKVCGSKILTPNLLLKIKSLMKVRCITKHDGNKRCTSHGIENVSFKDGILSWDDDCGNTTIKVGLDQSIKDIPDEGNSSYTHTLIRNN